MPRKRITKKLEHLVRDECKQACANPKCRVWATATHEIHHIDGDSSNSTLENLTLLCGSCHNQVTAGTFSESDVLLWKRMAQAGFLPLPAELEKPHTTIHNEGGIAGHTVNVGEVTFKQAKGSSKAPVLPGTIGADPDMRTYADYLVKRYIEWRKIGQKIDKRPFRPASVHGILGEGFGSPSSVMHISQERFSDWVRSAQAKIDGTVWGRKNKNRNYHTYQEHLEKRKGSAASEGKTP